MANFFSPNNGFKQKKKKKTQKTQKTQKKTQKLKTFIMLLSEIFCLQLIFQISSLAKFCY